MPRQEIYRRKRQELLWYLLGFVVVQMILAVGVDRFWTRVRDPEYAVKEKLLQRRLAEAPQKPLLQLPKHKIKYKMPFQRACNEKDEKGKLCAGHLKRWFYLADVLEQACGDVRQAFGDKAEIYRCEFCRTLFRPDPKQPPNSYTVRY